MEPGVPACQQRRRVRNWLAGFFYFNEEVNIKNFSYDTLAPGNPQNALATQYQKTKDYPFFGSLNWRVSDNWDLAGGMRYSNDDKDFWVAMPQNLPFIPHLDGRITRQVGDSFVSWDLSATYKVSQNVNIYGRASPQVSARHPSRAGSHSAPCPRNV